MRRCGIATSGQVDIQVGRLNFSEPQPPRPQYRIQRHLRCRLALLITKVADRVGGYVAGGSGSERPGLDSSVLLGVNGTKDAVFDAGGDDGQAVAAHENDGMVWFRGTVGTVGEAVGQGGAEVRASYQHVPVVAPTVGVADLEERDFAAQEGGHVVARAQRDAIDAVGYNLLGVAVDDRMHAGVLLVALAVDAALGITLGSGGVDWFRSVDVILDQVGWGGDGAGGDVARHDKDIGPVWVTEGEVAVGIYHPVIMEDVTAGDESALHRLQVHVVVARVDHDCGQGRPRLFWARKRTWLKSCSALYT